PTPTRPGPTASTPATGTVRPTLPTPTSTRAATVPPAPTGVLVEATGHVETAFATTVGGIVCAVSADGPQARCDVETSTYAKPPAPADCHGDWAGGVLLTPQGASLSCNTDTVLADAVSGGAGTWWESLPAARMVTRADGRQEVTLATDATVVAGSGATRLTCRSDGTSVTCAAGSARFTVSSTSYSLR
ncbi:MAG: hypothetical protein M3Y71_00405, partial [Actinomycetota bacterium]|nr:hypothetical protein [Actinomycetota bacterium]